MSTCERSFLHEQMWRWADVTEDVKMSTFDLSFCRWEDVREDRARIGKRRSERAHVKMSRFYLSCERRCEDEQMWPSEDRARRCQAEKMWQKVWRWADVMWPQFLPIEPSCEDEQMRRWADVREDVKMSRCAAEHHPERSLWRWADVKMSRCEDEQMWRWADVKMSRCEDEQISDRPHYWKNRCAQTLSGIKRRREREGEQMRRWADVKMSRCEDEQMWRWEDVKMSRCEGVKMSQMWRWEGVKMSRCEDGQMWRWEDVKMGRCEDEQMWRWDGAKMSRMWRWADVKMRGCEDERM